MNTETRYPPIGPLRVSVERTLSGGQWTGHVMVSQRELGIFTAEQARLIARRLIQAADELEDQ